MSSSTLEHFSHPKHPLVLKEDVVIGVDAKCYVCHKPVIGSPTYTCNTDFSDCRNFYLHKSCAELPKLITHHKHILHPLALLPRFDDNYCDVCGHRPLNVTYACDDCAFDVCVVCAFEQRLLRHEGHQQHILTLMSREALFECDACGKEARDASYSCNPCEFWIHKNCAFSPFIIPDPTYHPHPLNLIYSIPDMHRYFRRFCNICDKIIAVSRWLYYCHRCTYFVHMKCATSSDTISLANEIESDVVGNEPDLVQFPLPSEESLFELIMTQCDSLQLGFQGESESTLTVLGKSDDPHVIEEHWSHPQHPLELLQFTISENDDGRRVLVCDGCIQPITVSHPAYYACIQCPFFLHSFCATKLPRELPIGACLFHPKHSLVLEQMYRFYDFQVCGVCGYPTNGFYYKCEACDMKIEIRCAFLPTRIRHKSHKRHSLAHHQVLFNRCGISGLIITEKGLGYACQTCNGFRIHIGCVFYPSRMKHKYDDHPITLRHPPFFYEVVFYCEICEEQVDNQWLLYHCDKCDHSYHYACLCWFENVKLGGTIEHSIDNQPHTLALVLKSTVRRNSPPLLMWHLWRWLQDTILFRM